MHLVSLMFSLHLLNYFYLVALCCFAMLSPYALQLLGRKGAAEGPLWGGGPVAVSGV